MMVLHSTTTWEVLVLSTVGSVTECLQTDSGHAHKQFGGSSHFALLEIGGCVHARLDYGCSWTLLEERKSDETAMEEPSSDNNQSYGQIRRS